MSATTAVNRTTPLRFSSPSVAKAYCCIVAGAVIMLAALKLGHVVDLSTGAILVISIRLIVPLMIFRFWLVGGIVALVLDATDVIMVDLFSLGGFPAGGYAGIDKILDSYYYVIELIVVLAWTNRWMSVPAAILFAWRMIGAGLFEMTDDHAVLLIFPNMFENWWLYCVVVMKWFPRAVPHNWRTLLVPMLILLVPKMAQEYLLHVAEAHPWTWTKDNILSAVGIKF
jgi:hypothetical protein